MFRRFSLIFLSLLIGLTAYIVYAAVLIPGFVIPRTLRVHRMQAPDTRGTMSALRLLSQQNDLLISSLFPDPSDWRRKEPHCMMLTVRDQRWLLLIQNESERLEGSSEFSAEACSVVIPSSDTELSQEERFQRAIVLETNDKVVFRLKQELSFQTLTNLQLDMLTEGRLTGEVKVWSKMDPDDPADDFSMTMRDMSFNAEQIVTDSDVIFHYGNIRVEGKGLHVRVGLPEQKEGETTSETDISNPLLDRLRAGNLGGGFSIRDVRLAKLNLLEFEVPDFLPNLPQQDGWEETEKMESSEEKMMKMDVRCGGDLFFAPNMTDAPAVWCARFSDDVEITALHEEREQDTLRCDYLYLYLIDPELKQDWDQYGDSWRQKRKPSGNIALLAPYQVRAIGSEERKSALQIADSFFRAESGEILCEIDRQRLSLHPLPDTAEEDGTAEKTPDEKEKAFLQYGGTSVVSDRIEFTYDPNAYGSLKAYRKGKLTSEIPESDGSVSRVSAVWNDGVQIVPNPEYGEGIYTASFRGSVGFNWDRIGNLTADAVDFWFSVLKNGKPEQTMRPAGASSEKEDGSLSVRPKSARLSGQVSMKMERGTCNIQDCVEILFTEAAKIPGRQNIPTVSGKVGTPASEIFGGKGNSLMGGGEGGDSVFSFSGGRLKLWTVMTDDGGIDVSRITLQDQIQIVETDRSGQNEKLRIDGNVVSVENPGSERAALVLRGKPAEFSGYGLNLSGYDIKVDRAKNMFSVNGSGRLQITPRTGDSNAALSASASSFDAAKTEPVEVWWPKGMVFDGKSLVFQGRDSDNGGSMPQENNLVRVIQGRSLELKSQLISLILKRPVQIFELDMNRNGNGDMNGIELDQAVCQGSLLVPVSITWYGAIPLSGGNATGKNQNGLRGKGKGEVSHLTFTMATGDFSASGPGWLRGTLETPPEMMKQQFGNEKRDGSEGQKNPFSMSSSKPWTHFHIRFQDMMTGNINDQSLKVNGDVRSVVGTSDSPDMELDANERKTFPEDAFFLTCNELGGAGTLSPVSGTRNFEVSAFGETRFTYQNVTGLGKVLKYDHLKRNVILQGDGVSSASLNLQERPGAPVSTQSFNSASFNLETRKLDMNISEINYSNEK